MITQIARSGRELDKNNVEGPTCRPRAKNSQNAGPVTARR